MSRIDCFRMAGPLSGNKRSHALNHSRRVWNLNLQKATIVLPNGKTIRCRVSARTLKTFKKDQKIEK